MAARLKQYHDEATRKRIQVGVLIDRLHKDAMGEIQMTDGQRASIKILLGKALPDLASVTVSGDPNNPMELRVTWGTSQKS